MRFAWLAPLSWPLLKSKTTGNMSQLQILTKSIQERKAHALHENAGVALGSLWSR